MAPSHSPARSGRTGLSWATALPRLVITIGSPLSPTSSRRRRQVCLNSPAATVRTVREYHGHRPWTDRVSTSKRSAVFVPLLQVGQWVDRAAALVPAGGSPHLEVEVAGGGVAGLADHADRLA